MDRRVNKAEYKQGKCGYCGAPRRQKFKDGVGGKGSRRQHPKHLVCENGHQSMKETA